MYRQTGAGVFEGLAEFCTEALAEHGCPSVSVAVAERGEVVFAEAYGLADRATGRAATAETVYALASITKPLTATAVCIAADEGLLDLDAPVPGEYRGPAPTVRQVLQHRGGFGTHYDFHYGDASRRIAADWYARLYREPGSGFEYANIGYGLLGELLGDLDEFVRERVSGPLGLDSVRIAPGYLGPDPTAHRYTVDARMYPVCDTSHRGASSGWATAADLALFAQSYPRLLKPETAAAVLDAPAMTPHLGYGLGWCVSLGDGPVVHSHSGSMGGVANMVAFVPDRQLSVAVLTNGTGKAARDAVVQHLLGTLVPGFTPTSLSALADTTRPMDLPEGSWACLIRTPEGEVPVAVRVSADRQVEVRLDGATAAATGSASEDWDLRASVPLQLPTADACVNSPVLGLELRLNNGRLTGVARAYKNGDDEGWIGNFLSHPVS